ncbi:hypothetical protein JVU11DRAFT_159 [Chiua virens]|nr:hypothetical protein JVU11DRAFT_159 [Chiua virens]
MRFFSLNPFPPSQSPSIHSALCPPLDTTRPTTYPLSRTRAPSGVSPTSTAPSSDRRAQRNRNRDPTWIPRPRNAFIIFRCEFSRGHSQGSHESQDDDDVTNTVTVKTLSKRAAEAWKRLPPLERERYKALADKEREEHARRYPHYRFRPVKRQALGTRSLERERSQDLKGSAVEGPPALSTHVPSVLSRSNSSTTLAQGGSSPTPQLAAEPLSETLTYPIDAKAEFQMPSLSQESLERAQALEAYTIGLYSHDLLNSPFPFQSVMLDELF